MCLDNSFILIRSYELSFDFLHNFYKISNLISSDSLTIESYLENENYLLLDFVVIGLDKLKFSFLYDIMVSYKLFLFIYK
jgi:hypothetical protein